MMKDSEKYKELIEVIISGREPRGNFELLHWLYGEYNYHLGVEKIKEKIKERESDV